MEKPMIKIYIDAATNQKKEISAGGMVLLKDQEQIQSVTLPIKQELDPKMSYITNRRNHLYDLLSE